MRLVESEAHVWRVSLVDDPGPLQRLLACLSHEELERVRRLGIDDGRTFAVTRAALRNILALYLHTDAAALQLVTTPRGKPGLAAAAAVHFSVSHTTALSVVAVARAPIGVDVERVRQPRRLERVARRVLHADTALALAGLPPAQRTVAFLDAWTLREAHVKAVGGGLLHTADALPFDAAATQDGRVRTLQDRLEGAPWSVAHFEPSPFTRAALAVRGHIRDLRVLDWQFRTRS